MQAKPHKLVASECFFLLLCSSLEEIKFVVGSEFGLLIVWYWFLEFEFEDSCWTLDNSVSFGQED